jgi:hypothetical protein
MSFAPNKKNLQGGKGHKKRSNKESGSLRKNREITLAFMDDIENSADITGVILARVQKNFGGANMDLLTVNNDRIVAGLKGSLRCKSGAAKRCDNPIAIFPDSYVLLQDESYGYKIIGVLNRVQVKELEKYYPMAPRGFFNLTGIDEDEEDAFDWDEADENVDGEMDAEEIDKI